MTDVIIAIIFGLGLVTIASWIYDGVYWLAYGRVKLPK